MDSEDIKFTPQEDFFSEEFRSAYLKGLSYQARPGDLKLRALLPGWIAEGKVRLGSPNDAAQGKAQVAGEGAVGEAMTIGAGDVGKLNL